MVTEAPRSPVTAALLMALLAGPAAFAADPKPVAPDSAPPAVTPASPVVIEERYEKALKFLNKAANAAKGRDAGRVSLLLRRTDEEMTQLESTSGMRELAKALADSRARAAGGDLNAAAAALRTCRRSLVSLSNYTVGRSAEVAYRSAESALGDQNPDDFIAAVERLEAATLAPALLARVAGAREGVARARTSMVKNDMTRGRQEIDQARAAWQGIAYIGALSRARYALMVGAELLGHRALLAARDQTQRGLRELRIALEMAPESAQEVLGRARVDADTVWRRINKSEPGDAALLEAAGATVETVRQQLRKGAAQ